MAEENRQDTNEPQPEKKRRYFGRPADETFESFRKFYEEVTDFFGLSDHDPVDQQELEEMWRYFWTKR